MAHVGRPLARGRTSCASESHRLFFEQANGCITRRHEAARPDVRRAVLRLRKADGVHRLLRRMLNFCNGHISPRVILLAKGTL
jgi:hypothetical protein